MISIFTLLTGKIYSQVPLPGIYPTYMGPYTVKVANDNSYFIATNLQQGTSAPLTALQAAMLDVLDIKVHNAHLLSNQLYNKYKVKNESIYVSLYINNQGEAIFVNFMVKSDHRGNAHNSVQITADRLAEMEEIIKKFKFICEGNSPDIPYFTYDFWIKQHIIDYE